MGYTIRGLCKDNGKENGNYYLGFRVQVDRMWGKYGDLIITYPKPYSIYLRGTINPKLGFVTGFKALRF